MAGIIGGGVALFISLLAFFSLFTLWQLKLSDFFQPQRDVSDAIVIVAVDENTIDAQNGLGVVESWNRNIYAQTLDNINKYHPRVVGFDFFFRSPREKNGDTLFAEALANTNHPIIFYRMDALPSGNQEYFVQKENYILNPRPLEMFQLPNVTVSTAKAIADQDDVIRKIMPLVLDEKSGEYFENLSFAAARIYLDAENKPETPLIAHGEYVIHLKNGEEVHIPLEEGQMNVNFASFPTRIPGGFFSKSKHSYHWISFLDVYNENYSNYGNNPEKLFKDKIVLIGPSAIDFKDAYFVPTSDSVSMNGVEIHANTIQTILDRAFLRNMTLLEKIVFIFALALASAFVFMFTKIRWSSVYLLAVPGVYTALAPFAFSRGLIVDLVHPYLVLLSVFMAIYIYRYLTEFKQKMALKGAFAKYVNPTIAQQVAEHPEQLKLGGEKRDVTVLFTDIAHFTTISESLKPESLVALLNEYMEAMSSVIMGEGGTVDKYEGDAIMAFFGAPITQPDHAVRACRATLLMRTKLEQLLQKWATDPPLPGGEKKPAIDFRCGLSSGDVIIGNVGSSQRLEYTVMGDIVNLGSRLEGANKKYETHIMMSEATWKLAENAFEGRELDIVKVVGKAQPIKVYELLNYKNQLVPEAAKLLSLYNEGIALHHERKFAEALVKFEEILKIYPQDGPSKLYKQRCEVLRNFPPPPDWDGVFEMATK